MGTLKLKLIEEMDEGRGVQVKKWASSWDYR
jgi:hypothetical protein